MQLKKKITTGNLVVTMTGGMLNLQLLLHFPRIRQQLHAIGLSSAADIDAWRSRNASLQSAEWDADPDAGRGVDPWGEASWTH